MQNERLKSSLLKTIEAIQHDPRNAQAEFNVSTALAQGVSARARTRQFTIAIDEPEGLGGTDLAPNPVEYVLAALGACQEIVYAAYAAVRGIPLDAVSVEVKGPIDLHGLFGLKEGVAPGFREITYHTVIESPADREDIEALIATVERHCPVLDTLVNPVKVSGSVEIRSTVPSSN
ncbi:MAG: OsmC family protein [Flavobacteriales bacterium]